jgi:protocadherin Fat 1/2/3
MSSSANIVLLVLDVNDNPPEFERILYSSTVSESLVIGSRVCTVYATSKDTGINAEITYTIVGGNEQARFLIDGETGKFHIIGQFLFSYPFVVIFENML